MYKKQITITRRIIAMDSNDKNLGYRTSSLTILSKTSSSSSPGNGDSPTNISKMSTPSPHQSTARVYEVSVNTSGAKNSGVPQKVPVRSPYPMPSLQRPKSAIFTQPSVSSNKLSNFRSLKKNQEYICVLISIINYSCIFQKIQGVH